jgi:hypothetical protein
MSAQRTGVQPRAPEGARSANDSPPAATLRWPASGPQHKGGMLFWPALLTVQFETGQVLLTIKLLQFAQIADAFLVAGEGARETGLKVNGEENREVETTRQMRRV